MSYQAYEMANLTRQNSGEPFDIWIDSAGKNRNTKHNEPRLKASNNGVTIIAGFKNGSYSNFQTSKDKIKQFGKNKELKEYMIKIEPLLRLHWEGKVDDLTFLNAASFVKKGYDVLDAINKAIALWKEDKE